MKLTCMVIVAVLLLTACQLNTADGSRDKQEDRLVKLFNKRWNSPDSRLTRKCQPNGYYCDFEFTPKCCLKCDYNRKYCQPY
uniref:Conotoxin Im6.1 n=1 Tax=Conus imperialis TaxID=35631 RepID=M9PQ90_CONIM|nr:conotoxin Im6.1 [Conus imperialis]